MSRSMRQVYVRLKLTDPKKLRGPTPRNRVIFDAVRIEKRSLRDVAAEHQLSHPRVLAIVRQVERWLGETVGRGGTGDWLQRKGVAEYLHRQRLDHLYGEAVNGWHTSQQRQKVWKAVQVEGKPVRQEVVEKTTSGDHRFLNLAMQIDDMRMAFDYESGSIQPPEDDEMHDDERKSEAAKVLADAYYDRLPDEPEPDDARRKEERAKEEAVAKMQEQLAEAESRRLRLEEEVQRLQVRQIDVGGAGEAAGNWESGGFLRKGGDGDEDPHPNPLPEGEGTGRCGAKSVVPRVSVATSAVRGMSVSTSAAHGMSVANVTTSPMRGTGFQPAAMSQAEEAERIRLRKKRRAEELFPPLEYHIMPVDVGGGLMVVPPRMITNWVDRQKFIAEYWEQVGRNGNQAG